MEKKIIDTRRDGKHVSDAPGSNGVRKVSISTRHIAAAFLAATALLLITNVLIIYLRFVRGHEHLRGFIHGFYFDAEANIPSLYSALAMLFSATLLWLTGRLDAEKKERRSVYWKFLSLFFVFLALDEFGSLHEYLIEPMRAIMAETSFDSQYLYFAWLIPYSILVVIIGLLLFRFLFKVPARTRWLFIAGGALFLAGAVGMEMLGGRYWSVQGWAIDGSDDVDLQYALIVTVEELLEMLGIVVFIFALTEYYLRATGKHDFFVRVSDR